MVDPEAPGQYIYIYIYVYIYFILKKYFRSIKLVILLIEKKMLAIFKYKNLFNNFASKEARIS